MALGHALAIGLVVFVLFVLGTAVPLGWLQLGGATILLGLGGWRLWRTRHPIWVGMRVGFWDLTSWSWIMASAHGAGLMLIPLLLGATCGETLSGGPTIERSRLRSVREYRFDVDGSMNAKSRDAGRQLQRYYGDCDFR
jgi:hypothetical protein